MCVFSAAVTREKEKKKMKRRGFSFVFSYACVYAPDFHSRDKRELVYI